MFMLPETHTQYVEGRNIYFYNVRVNFWERIASQADDCKTTPEMILFNYSLHLLFSGFLYSWYGSLLSGLIFVFYYRFVLLLGHKPTVHTLNYWFAKFQFPDVGVLGLLYIIWELHY